jgi:hypothetical protein
MRGEETLSEGMARIREENRRWEGKMEKLMKEGGGAGEMEEEIGRESRELSRVALEKALQAKADRSGRKCPVCGEELVRNKAGADDREPVRAGEGEPGAREVSEVREVDVSSGSCAWAGAGRMHAGSAGDGGVDGEQDAGV